MPQGNSSFSGPFLHLSKGLPVGTPPSLTPCRRYAMYDCGSVVLGWMDGSGVGYGRKALPTAWYLHSGWDHSGHPYPLLAPSLPMVQAQIPQSLSWPASPLSFSPAPIPLGATQGGRRGHLGFSELDKILWAPPCSPDAECSAGLCKGEGCPEDHRAGMGLKGRAPASFPEHHPLLMRGTLTRTKHTSHPPSFALRVCNLSCQRGTRPGRTLFEKNNFFVVQQL